MRSTVAIALLCLLATSTSAASLVSSLKPVTTSVHQKSRRIIKPKPYVPFTFEVFSTVRVLIQTSTGAYIAGFPNNNNNGNDNGRTVVTDNVNTDLAKWTLVNLKSGKVALKSFWGTYLSVSREGELVPVLLSDTLGEQQTFDMVYNLDGTFALKSFFNSYVSPPAQIDFPVLTNTSGPQWAKLSFYVIF